MSIFAVTASVTMSGQVRHLLSYGFRVPWNGNLGHHIAHQITVDIHLGCPNQTCRGGSITQRPLENVWHSQADMDMTTRLDGLSVAAAVTRTITYGLRFPRHDSAVKLSSQRDRFEAPSDELDIVLHVAPDRATLTPPPEACHAAHHSK
jgi:hypothetical protein